MESFVRRATSTASIPDKINAQVITATITIERDGKKATYNPNDYIIMFEEGDSIKCAFMTATQLNQYYEQEVEQQDDVEDIYEELPLLRTKSSRGTLLND